ncbi:MULTISPECIES: site-specific integrase [unclassified Rathayibacter]|uniref:tyrosine-type recombinase/integrase n=1 Tax=unclassified Rathayibacter TaxID=2609250 RepID=UPI000CE88068|nr:MULTISPECIES: site-specific integrase [unclassified Rathayibacter]PPG07100.1 hypothetical protein C5C26_10485 [Rathayibacter sp. AY2B1]PPG73048.1 hypothetical protein C5C59_04135 [Rathayibacter sp. AY1F4]
MANVRAVERKGGTAYECRWRDGNGGCKQRTFLSKREAERFALKVESELEKGASTEPLVKNSKTVAEVVTASLAASKPELKPRTYRSAELLYSGRVLPRFGKRRIATLTRAEVQTWIGELHAEGLAPMTVHHCYVALRKVCRHALHDRLISYNPRDGVKLPKNHDAGQVAPTLLTTAQVEALAGKLSDSGPYDLLVRSAAYTGLRAGKLAGLRVQGVDVTQGHVQVPQTMQHVAGECVAGTPKSKRSTRDVRLMHSGLIRDLRRYLLQHPHSGDPSALFRPGRAVGGKHAPDYSRVMDNASFRRNYFRPRSPPRSCRTCASMTSATPPRRYG